MYTGGRSLSRLRRRTHNTQHPFSTVTASFSNKSCNTEMASESQGPFNTIADTVKMRIRDARKASTSVENESRSSDARTNLVMSATRRERQRLRQELRKRSLEAEKRSLEAEIGNYKPGRHVEKASWKTRRSRPYADSWLRTGQRSQTGTSSQLASIPEISAVSFQPTAISFEESNLSTKDQPTAETASHRSGSLASSSTCKPRLSVRQRVLLDRTSRIFE